MQITRTYIDELTYSVIGCAIQVHKQLGPGLIESVYEKCFIRELTLQKFKWRNQISVPLSYKGEDLEAELRIDVLVEDLLLVELKAVESILPVHKAKVLTYMKLLKVPKGVLINFNCTNIFEEGQMTFVNEIYANLPPN